MMYLLDTNVCVKHLNGQSESVRQRLASVPPQSVLLYFTRAQIAFFQRAENAG